MKAVFFKRRKGSWSSVKLREVLEREGATPLCAVPPGFLHGPRRGSAQSSLLSPTEVPHLVFARSFQNHRAADDVRQAGS